MTGMVKTLLALGLLVVTNLATFGYATWRCRQETQGHQRLLTESGGRTQALEGQVKDLQGQLDRLAVWREFVELQRDVSVVEVAINRLNYGDAIAGIERMEARLERGEYGETFQQRRAELLPSLYQAKDALRGTSQDARSYLAELEQQAFRLLAATSDVPGGPRGAATPTPAPSPIPTVEPPAVT